MQRCAARSFCVYEPSAGGRPRRRRPRRPGRRARAPPPARAARRRASRAASIASQLDIERIACASSTERISSTSRISRACWCSHAPTSVRLRSDEPPAATQRPRVPRVSSSPSASRLESASRSTVRETPSCSTSSRSVGSRSPAASWPWRIRELIASVAASTSEPSLRRCGSRRRRRRARPTDGAHRPKATSRSTPAPATTCSFTSATLSSKRSAISVTSAAVRTSGGASVAL